MNVVIMGPPGAGKGTQAKTLADEFGFLHLSPGDLLRAAVKNGAEVGRKAKVFMDSGRLVPDNVIVELIEAHVRSGDAGRGVILDGFPRTIGQADALSRMFAEIGRPLDAVVNVVLPEDEAVGRLTGRRVCRQCGANYHVLYKPPQVKDRCDLCGGQLYQRSDDSEETARARFEVYRKETEPLVSYYASRGLLRNMDGQGGAEEVGLRLRRVLGLHE